MRPSSMPPARPPLGVVALVPSTNSFDEDDDRWLDQVTRLRRDLHSQVEGVDLVLDSSDVARGEASSVAGTKGRLDEILLLVLSAQGVHALAGFLRTWLARDRARSLELVLVEGDTRKQLTVRGDAIDVATLRRALELEHDFQQKTS